MPRPLPPLNSIRAFEAAARHMNFSHAAEELGVTPSAVSKQIILLEDYIGVQLFERLPGNLNLTIRGVILREAVSPAFEALETAFDRFSRNAPRSNIVRLSTLSSFAMTFLVHRLPKFKKQHPHINLEILTSDRVIDLSTEEVDLSVRTGHGQWEGLISEKLGSGAFLPVCAPALHDKHWNGDIESFVKNVGRAQVFSNNEWIKWSETIGINPPTDTDIFVMEDYLVALQAVLEGQIIALLPEIIVRKHLKDGRLMQFSETEIDYMYTYYIAHKPNAECRPVVQETIKWLKAEANEPL